MAVYVLKQYNFGYCERFRLTVNTVVDITTKKSKLPKISGSKSTSSKQYIVILGQKGKITVEILWMITSVCLSFQTARVPQ